MQQRIQAVLDFWFGVPPAAVTATKQRMKLWFGGRAGDDRIIASRFDADLDAAVNDRLDDWASLDKGLIALVVVLDQFSRVIHRDTPRAFAADAKAAGLAHRAVSAGRDRRFTPLERAFLYMPLEHSEDLSLQDLSVARFRSLAEEVDSEYREPFQGFSVYAEQHREVIRRFGRFPHRNAALGRASTPEETRFLAKSGRGF